MKQLITIRRYDGQEYVIALPKTLAEQVATVKEHVDDTDVHISTDDRKLLTKVVNLNEESHIDSSLINNNTLSSILEFSSLDEFKEKANTFNPGQFGIIIQEDKSWELYRLDNNHECVKVADTLSMDINEYSYKEIKDAPTSSVEQIDSMVNDSHLHENLKVLDGLDELDFSAKKSLSKAATIIDGQIPPNTDGLGLGTMMFVIHDPKVNPKLELDDSTSLPSVLLTLNEGLHTESIATVTNENDGYITAVKNIQLLNTSKDCNGTVRHSMTRNDGEVFNTDYIITPQETRVISIDESALYTDHQFTIVDLDKVDNSTSKKYGVEIEITCEEVRIRK